MTIRIAAMTDARDIVNLAVAFRDHLQRETPTDSEFYTSVERLLSGQDAEFFVCESNTGIVGYVLQRYRHSMWISGTEATIEDLFVDPCVRQSGFGRKLIEFAIGRAKNRGCATVCLDTNENNVASQRIYKSLGFNSFSKRWNGNQIFYRLGLK